MAIVIDYYVPENFRKKNGPWIAPEQRGIIIAFPHCKRSLLDVTTLPIIAASELLASQGASAFCSSQQSIFNQER